eukprot:1138560-Pelagomonas_calceolata.AAC.1
MTKLLNHSVLSGHHSPTRQPLWFDAECSQKKKRAFIIAAKSGVAWNACQQLQRQYKSCAQQAKRRYTQVRTAIFLDKLYKKDPSVHNLIKKSAVKHVTPVSAAWQDHLNAAFRQRADRPAMRY